MLIDRHLNRYDLWPLLILGWLILLYACSKPDESVAAPLGDKETLEVLAEAYKAVRLGLPTSPAGLRPMGKRKFLEGVFSKAGYNYSKTIIALAALPEAQVNQNHRDLKQLLFMPHVGLKPDSMESLYSTEELAAIRVVTKLIK